MTLRDLPLRTLRRMLRDTIRFAGPHCQSVQIIRRTLREKRNLLCGPKEGATNA
jgi:hypothetical protein